MGYCSIYDSESDALFLQTINRFHPSIVQKCKELFENQRYDNAVFDAMKVVEDAVRSKSGLSPTDVGIALVDKAVNPTNPII